MKGNPMANPQQNKSLMTIGILVLVAVVAYLLLTKPDERNPVQKMGDAIEQLPNGPDKAARELQDRTPGERIKDAVKDETK